MSTKLNTQQPRVIHVLNLGAGVQSTCLYLMAMNGWLHYPNKVDVAVFADTQAEPQAVYHHLEWLLSLDGPRIYVGTRGSLEEDLKRGENSSGHRFASIPAFTAPEGATYKHGIVRRQCTEEYKIRVIEREVRRTICGMEPGRRLPLSTQIKQYFGISTDESQRADKIISHNKRANWDVRFPLIEMSMSRADCIEWLQVYGKVPHEVPRSACVFCPYHTDKEWLRLKTEDPDGWARAVAVDEALRIPGNVVTRGMDQKLYLHPKVRPLVQIEFNPESKADFGVDVQECEGMCGN